jgi:hypothetical protein
VQSEILEKNPRADLAVYAVWLPFLGGSEEAINTHILADPRVVQFWDGDRLTSTWFGDSVFGGSLAWDVYLLYGPGATLIDTPAEPVSAGGTVIGQSGRLRSDLTALLEKV